MAAMADRFFRPLHGGWNCLITSCVDILSDFGDYTHFGTLLNFRMLSRAYQKAADEAAAVAESGRQAERSC